MTRWFALFVGLLVLVGSRDSSAQKSPEMTHARLSASFAAVVACSRQLSDVVRDIEKTRDVQSRGKSATARVKPADIAGAGYLDQLLGPKGHPGGIISVCDGHYRALIHSPSMQYVPESWKRPGSTVESGTSSLVGARIEGGALQNIASARLSAVHTNIAKLRGHANAFLRAVNGLQQEALKNFDIGAGHQTAPSTPARHFEKLRTCASKLATLANDMQGYRDRTYRGKAANFRIAPRTAVGARNIDDIFKVNGWLDQCRAEHARIANAPMNKYLPADFMKPHYGAFDLMKTYLGAMRVNGAFLNGTGQQRLASIDQMLGQFRQASRDFLGRVNYAYGYADRQPE